MQYQEAVTQGRRLVQQEGEIRFALGELALAIAPMGKHGVNHGVQATLQTFAEDIGVEFETLDKYRQVAAAWPEGIRIPSVSWSVHQTLQSMPNRAELIRSGMKVQEARQLAGRRPARGVEETRYGFANLPPEEKAEVVREALQDEQVAERVVADDQTALSITKARAKHTHQRETEQREAQNMRAPALADAGDLAELGNNMAHIATRLELLAEQVQRTRTDQRDQFAREWADIKRLVGWVDSVLSGESMDEGLSKLLNGGDDR